MDPTLVAVAFATIFVVELPDKTFVATLVLSTRYPPLAVWVGVGLAFAVQTLVAVTAGGFLGLLPERLVAAVAATIFLLGAVLLLRTARGAQAAEQRQEQEYAARAGAGRSGVAAVATSFAVLFAAEWGDLSQLLTMSLVASRGDVVAVFLGAWGALLTVSGLAVLLGRWLLRRIRLATLHLLGAGVCLVLFAVTATRLLP